MRKIFELMIGVGMMMLAVLPAEAALTEVERGNLGDYVSQLNGCAPTSTKPEDTCPQVLALVQGLLEAALSAGRITTTESSLFVAGALNAVTSQYPADQDLPVALTGSPAYQSIVVELATAGDAQTCDVLVASATDFCGL